MGQTEITRCCDGLMHKNGEQNVINFACAESHHLFACVESRHLFVCRKSSSFA
jgi:hypothetical protein